MFKKLPLFICTLLLSALLMITVALAAPVESKDYNLIINGEKVVFDAETPPIIEGGNTLLPLRFIYNIINKDGTGTMDWDKGTQQITVAYGETEANLWIGKTTAVINGKETPINGAAPLIYNSYTYVPLRFFADTFDMTINWDKASKTAFVMDNEMLDKIMSIMGDSGEISEGSKISAEMIMDLSVSMDIMGASQSMDMKAEGKIEQDYAGKFQHIVMQISVMGQDMAVETYDDGKWMYTVAGDQVIKMTSSFEVAENIIPQLNMSSGLDIGREFYAALKLEDKGGNYIISGNMYVPEDYFSDILSNIGGFGGLEDILSGVTMKFNKPIGYKVTVNKETGALVSMSMSFDMGMTMNIEGEEYSVNASGDVKIPKFDTNAKFDSAVPKEIIDKAVEM